MRGYKPAVAAHPIVDMDFLPVNVAHAVMLIPGHAKAGNICLPAECGVSSCMKLRASCVRVCVMNGIAVVLPRVEG